MLKHNLRGAPRRLVLLHELTKWRPGPLRAEFVLCGARCSKTGQNVEGEEGNAQTACFFEAPLAGGAAWLVWSPARLSSCKLGRASRNDLIYLYLSFYLSFSLCLSRFLFSQCLTRALSLSLCMSFSTSPSLSFSGPLCL
jgi:hypothetical protein